MVGFALRLFLSIHVCVVFPAFMFVLVLLFLFVFMLVLLFVFVFFLSPLVFILMLMFMFVFIFIFVLFFPKEHDCVGFKFVHKCGYQVDCEVFMHNKCIPRPYDAIHTKAI